MNRAFIRWIPSLLAGLLVAGAYRSTAADSKGFNTAEWEQQLRQPALTEKEFTTLYASAIAAELKDAKVEVTGPGEITVKTATGSFKAFSNNAWAEVNRNSEYRVEICRRYIKTIVEAAARPATGPKALPNTNQIVAIVRDELYVQQFLNLAQKSTNALDKLPAFETFVADLRVVYAVDSVNGIATLTEGDRKQLGFERPALRQLAVANLRRILSKAKLYGTGPVFMLVADGNYESSLLLDDRVWDEQAKLVHGDLVAAVPSRDVLLFTGSDSPEGISEIRQKCAKIMAGGGRVISKTLLIRRNGHWEEFKQ